MDGIIIVGDGLQHIVASSNMIIKKYISITMDKVEKLDKEDRFYDRDLRKVILDGLNEEGRALLQEIIGEMEPEYNGRFNKQPSKMDASPPTIRS